RPSGSPAHWRCKAGDRGAYREIADCGVRIADCQRRLRAARPHLANPQSTIRNQQWGGAVTRVGVDVGGSFSDRVAVGGGGVVAVLRGDRQAGESAMAWYRGV